MVSTKIFRYIQRVEREASKLLELDNTPRVAAEIIVIYCRYTLQSDYPNTISHYKVENI
jgi:hypothetical protein